MAETGDTYNMGSYISFSCCLFVVFFFLKYIWLPPIFLCEPKIERKKEKRKREKKKKRDQQNLMSVGVVGNKLQLWNGGFVAFAVP